MLTEKEILDKYNSQIEIPVDSLKELLGLIDFYSTWDLTNTDEWRTLNREIEVRMIKIMKDHC